MTRTIAVVLAFAAAVLAGFAPAPASAQDTQYTVAATGIQSPTLPFTDGGYAANGQFTINVGNGNCVGTYTINAAPLAGSGPSGSTPPFTAVTTYIGFGQGNFLFANAGAGTYRVTVTETGACNPPVDPTQLDVVVPDASATQHAVTPTGIASPSLPFVDPGYVANGQFTINVANGSCVGIYTINASPLAGSGPGGSTPPFTAVTTYIGFGQGNFLFANAGVGTYRVTVTESGPSCNPPVNPVIVDVVVPGVFVPTTPATPVPMNAPLALLFASLALAVAGWRTLRRRA